MVRRFLLSGKERGWDFKNLLHFTQLRSDGHAQSEIQEYSNAIGLIVKELFPWNWEAYNKYKFQLVENNPAIL